MKDKPSKAERRKQRQEEKAQARKVKSVRFSSSVDHSVIKTVKIAPIPELSLKVVKVQEEPSRNKSLYFPSEELL
jgi:hypothetical protein